MSWMKHIDQTINETFATEAPPRTPEQMSEVLRQLGHLDVARYVARLGESEFDSLLFSIEVRQMNEADESCDELTDVELDRMAEETKSVRSSGYANYGYEAAYACK